MIVRVVFFDATYKIFVFFLKQVKILMRLISLIHASGLSFYNAILNHIRFNNFEEAVRILFKYVEVYYNQRNKRSANGRKKPAHCEREWYNLKNVA